LKDWNINIYRGILTGYNDAFIIDGKKKDELIAEDPKSAEIIRPLLRGRDIKRYACEFADLFIITTFPSLKIDIEKYPAVKQHLMKFGYDRLKQTGDKGSRKKTHNKWFETQDSISYWDDFSKQKIVWGEISDKTKFSIDMEGKYMNEATTFLMVGESLLYLLAYLNSKLSEYYFSKIGTTTGVGTVRWKKFTIEQLLVPKIEKTRQLDYEKIVLEILENVAIRKDVYTQIDMINQMIYKEFKFTKEEIYIIENQ
jgi:adenine-specific DNA-methyltransferase